MDNKIFIDIEFNGTYGASLELLPGCVAVSPTFPELRRRIEEAVAMHLAAMREDGDEIPAVFNSDYELCYRFDAPALLVHYDGIFTKSALSRMTGINEKQLWHYASGVRHPRPAQRQRIITGLHSLGRELMTVEL
jgi:predicted RNase H-like HicB family nuclease